MAIGARGTALGQGTPLRCVANAATTPYVGPTEMASLVGDIVVACSGGTPTPTGQPVPTVDFQIALSANITSRLTGNYSEAVVLIDEAAPNQQVACTPESALCGWTGGSKGPNVFAAKVTASNTVTFQNVPLDPTGTGAPRVFRFMNLRADASQLGLSSIPIPTSINATISITSVPVTPSSLTVAFIPQTLKTAILTSTADAALPANSPVALQNCVTADKLRFATLRFSELTGDAFRPRTVAAFQDTETSPTPAAQATPGSLYSSTSGFYNPALPSDNGLDHAGLADFGTRLQAVFTNLPAGATIYVPTVAVTFTNGVPAPNSGNLLRARLVASVGGAFSPVPATEVLDGIPAAVLPITNGGTTAVWEVLQSSPGMMEDANFPVWISYPANSVQLNTSSVVLQLGPTSTVKQASETDPLPRYKITLSNFQLLTIRNMCPGSGYVITTYPEGLPMQVDGQDYISPQSFNWTAKTSHTVSVATIHTPGPGARQRFLGWTDSGAASHTITLPEFPNTYVAYYAKEYQLTLDASPAGSGTFVTQPASADGYFAADTHVTVTALPTGTNTFSGFTLPYPTLENPVTLFLYAPMTVTASFTGNAGTAGVVGLAPTNGGGSAGKFHAVFQGSQGASSLEWAQMLVGAAPDGGGAPFCFLHYDVRADEFWLYSDQDGFFHGPVKAGTPSDNLQSTMCALDTEKSSATTPGGQLYVHFSPLFKLQNMWNVYLRTRDASGVDTGWTKSGLWSMTPMAAQAMSVTTAAGSGSSVTFQAKFDPIWDWNPGPHPHGWQQFLIAADPSGGGQPFCFVHYDRAGAGLWMYSSDVGFFLGPVAPGTASTALDSSACSVDTAGATASIGGDFSSTLTLPLTLKAPMSGAKKVYMRTLDPLQRDSGWVEAGTYQVP